MSLEFMQKPKDLKELFKNKLDSQGFIRLGDLPRDIFDGRQIKSIAAFLDGEEGLNPEVNLGKDLIYFGKSGNYSDMKINIDSLEKFINRVKIFYKNK